MYVYVRLRTSGSIGKWLLKEGDKFEAGQSICEVETDKASVSFDATDEGYVAKILVGTEEIKVSVLSYFDVLSVIIFHHMLDAFSVASRLW